MQIKEKSILFSFKVLSTVLPQTFVFVVCEETGWGLVYCRTREDNVTRSKQTQRALYNTNFLLAVCYQCHTQTPTVNNKKQITTTVMKYLRKQLKVRRRDEIRNDIIRARAGITPVVHITQEQHLE